MDTISPDLLVRASEALSLVSTDATAEIHTVTLTLDGRSGHCLMVVESVLGPDMVLVVK